MNKNLSISQLHLQSPIDTTAACRPICCSHLHLHVNKNCICRWLWLHVDFHEFFLQGTVEDCNFHSGFYDSIPACTLFLCCATMNEIYLFLWTFFTAQPGNKAAWPGCLKIVLDHMCSCMHIYYYFFVEVCSSHGNEDIDIVLKSCDIKQFVISSGLYLCTFHFLTVGCIAFACPPTSIIETVANCHVGEPTHEVLLYYKAILTMHQKAVAAIFINWGWMNGRMI